MSQFKPKSGIERETRFKFVDLLFLICLLWFDLGVVGAVSFYRAAANVVLFAIAAFLACSTDHKILPRLSSVGFFWGVAYLLMITLPSFFSGRGLSLDFWNTLYALMILFAFLYFSNRTRFVQKIVFWVILLDQILINIRSYFLMLEQPNLARYLATGKIGEFVNAGELDTFLLCSFDHVYALVLILPFLILYWKDAKENGLKSQKQIPFIVLTVVYFISSVFVVAAASFTTAILFMVFFLICALFSSKTNAVATSLTTIVFAVLLLVFAVPVLEFISENFFADNFEVQARLTELARLFGGDDRGMSGDFGSRMARLTQSWEAFAENPFFGIFEGEYDEIEDVIGNHSEWVDGLAKYGVFRFATFVTFLVTSLRGVYRTRRTPSAIFLIYLLLIVLGFLNPILWQKTYLALFILIPLMLPPRISSEEEAALEDPAR
ncbi:MAG: O-antigen ligase family protein [Clostridia bacterium]|nr:O-antigen ligase family protein [Clostridia bacterium]